MAIPWYGELGHDANPLGGPSGVMTVQPPILVDYHPNADGGVALFPPRCMSLACEHWGRCRRDASGNYPSDCTTGALSFGNDMGGPQGPPVIGQSASASSPAPFDLLSTFSNMSTSTLVILGAAAYFFLFRKGR